MLFTVRGVFSFLLYAGSVNQMLSQGLEQKQARGFPWQKNNKMLLLAAKRKTNSYHMKKIKKGKRERTERMNSRVWFTKSHRMSELQTDTNKNKNI